MRISKNPVNEIEIGMNTFKSRMQNLLVEYQQRAKADNDRIMVHKNDYQPAYLQQLLDEAQQANIQSIQPKYDAYKADAESLVKFYTSMLTRKVDQHYQEKPRPEFVAMIQGYQATGHKMSRKEYKLRLDDCVCFAERQMLKEKFLNDSKAEGVKTIENPYLKADDKTDTDKSSGGQIINADYESYGFDECSIDEAYEILDHYREMLDLALNHYCCGNEGLYRLTGHNDADYDVPAEDQNAYVQDAGEGNEPSARETIPNMNFAVYGTNAGRFWETDESAKVKEEIDKLNNSCQRRSDLTPYELNILHSIFTDIPKNLLPETVKNVADADPRLATLLELSEEYGKYLD